MASFKRRQNKKLHQRRPSRARSRAEKRTTVASPTPARDEPMPSETDQMGVFIGEAELGLPEQDLAALRSMVGRLPFESAVVHVAVLLCRLGPRLNDPPRQWELAKQFYASRPELLAAYERVLKGNLGFSRWSQHPPDLSGCCSRRCAVCNPQGYEQFFSRAPARERA